MSLEVVAAITAVFALAACIAGKHAILCGRLSKQHEIARRGTACTGRVVAIQRPFLLDPCTRLYFDFIPSGADRPLRACHVDHGSLAQLRTALPPTGALVSVHYLPERPTDAVITTLLPSTNS